MGTQWENVLEGFNEEKVSVTNEERYSQDGSYVLGIEKTESISKEGVLSVKTRPYFRCKNCQEKVYGVPGKDALCKKHLIWKYAVYGVVGIAGLYILGRILVFLAPYLIAGAIGIAIILGGMKKPPTSVSR